MSGNTKFRYVIVSVVPAPFLGTDRLDIAQSYAANPAYLVIDTEHSQMVDPEGRYTVLAEATEPLPA